eukprot:CAMPEP_0171132954 /NCGR_PEP_ID=MMETSP0766_2-20121228/125443_1 /TAXON_ID=439317 /ORGANISM="Gambierdiscus australes, Strain CAWD 149" /LENGTH=40 /DNA_ID= /DNA_START= /DNA_END= /DNA_ORIENTATION=
MLCSSLSESSAAPMLTASPAPAPRGKRSVLLRNQRQQLAS